MKISKKMIVCLALIFFGLVIWLKWSHSDFKEPVKKPDDMTVTQEDLSPLDKDIPECELIAPHERPVQGYREFPEKSYDEVFDISSPIDFSEKKHISKGKFGFRKKLVIEKQSIVTQYIPEDIEFKNIHYGIYKDNKLIEPIKEVKMKDVLDVILDIENGASLEYPEPLAVVLEPGTYYMGVYTTNSEDVFDISSPKFESWKAVIDTELNLEENKWGYFFSADNKQKTFFKIQIPKAGIIKIKGDVNAEISLCNDRKDVIEKTMMKPVKNEKHKIPRANIEVSEAGTYYLQIITTDEKPIYEAAGVRYSLI